jgi:hypothetical protein
VPPPRLLVSILAVAALLSGCDSSQDGSAGPPSEREPTATATTPAAPPGATARGCGETTVAGTAQLRVTGVGCDVGRGIVAAWANEPACSPTQGASRSSCSVRDGYRCLGAAAGQGLAVSCARPGSSIAFVARRS